jgi:hypothetical protein
LDLNKIPRWALVMFAIVGISSCGVLISTARADLDKFKTIAAEAKHVSDANTASIVRIEDSLSEVKVIQEQFRREYREDQKDLDKKLSMIAKAVKA